MKKILHLLVSGKTGGVERLCVDISRLSHEENHFYFFWGGGKCEELIKKKSPTVVRNCSYIRIVSEAVAFKRYLKQNDFDVVIIHFPAPLMLIFTFLIPKKMALILYLHADPKALFEKRITKLLFSLIKSSIVGNICVSEFVSSGYKTHSNKTVIYNGTNFVSHSHIDKKYKKSVIQLIYNGRLVAEKGLQNLFKSLNSIEYPYKLLIVGDGDYRSELEILKEKLELGSNIMFCGECANVEDYLKQSDLFVHPAICKEGFGITLIEAMAYSVPCIAFDRGAVGEIIDDEVNGFLVKEFSNDAFTMRLNKVFQLYYENYDKYIKISNSAYNKSLRFSSERYVRKLEEYIYDTCR